VASTPAAVSPPAAAPAAAPPVVPPAAPVVAPPVGPPAAPPPVAPAAGTAAGSATAAPGDDPGDGGTSANARPDLSHLPPFLPAPVPAGQEWDLDTVMRFLDPYHQNPQDALGPAMQAVVAMPGSAPARYLLACALAASGWHDDARAVLQALRAVKDCPSCTDALLNTAGDLECSFEPRAVALANGLRPSAIRVATGAVLGALISGDVAAATPYLDASRPAQFSFAGLECDAECVNTVPYPRKKIIELVRGADHRREQGEEYRGPTRLFCDQDCCSGPNPSHSHAPVVHVDKVCFRKGPRPLLESLAAGVDG
jgi:hypothetical protein